MLFLTESAAACVIFTILIQLAINNRRTAFVNDYPPVVTDRLRELGLIAEKPPVKKKDIIRKIIAMVFFSIAFALVLRFINGIETFAKASYTAYALWLVVDWYDFLVMDILLAPFDSHSIITHLFQKCKPFFQIYQKIIRRSQCGQPCPDSTVLQPVPLPQPSAHRSHIPHRRYVHCNLRTQPGHSSHLREQQNRYPGK